MARLSRAWISVHHEYMTDQCLHKAFSLNGCDEILPCMQICPALLGEKGFSGCYSIVIHYPIRKSDGQVKQNRHTLRPSRHLSQRGPTYMIRGLLVDCDKKALRQKLNC